LHRRHDTTPGPRGALAAGIFSEEGDMDVLRASLRAPLLALALGAWAAPAWAGPAEDAYLQGYAAAVLEREFAVRDASVVVKDGVVTVRPESIRPDDRAKALAAISGIRGVNRVVMEAQPGPPGPAPALPPPTAAERVPAPGPKPEPRLPTGWLPAGLLFDPLLADPRWPSFSAAYQRYIDDKDFRDVAAVSFGETFPFYRGDVPMGGQWEIGFQAGVFAIFDMDSDSHDLINADYFAAIPVSYRNGPFSAIARVFHQSSHLGDEFLLRTKTNRINLSYEGVDARLSYDFLDRAVRVYGGAGYLFDQDPSSIKPWSIQYGVELQSPWTLWNGLARPILAADFQHRQENDWSADASARGGLQFESVQVLGRKLQLTLEYFNGHSPNGQFYKDRIQYFGLGAHLFY
jgi:hypothetical protein